MKTGRILFYTLLSIVFLTGCRKENDNVPDQYVNTGDPIPVFTLSGNKGTYDSSLTEGKITLITFFDPSCGDCQRELPKLLSVWETLGGEAAFEMVNIARGKTLEQIASGTDGGSWLSMPCYPDPDRLVYNLFAKSTIPRVYLVGPDGTVKKMWVEMLKEEGKELSAEEFQAIIEGHLESL